MPIITIYLTDEQYLKVKETLSYNGKIDLEEETLSGSTLEIGLVAGIAIMNVSGYKNEDIGFVRVEFSDLVNSSST
ncbi:MAG TPA: hypothetical protein VL022_01965 [Moheibacter sp.]|nr:hypothetical protein [Moheibacter sp.]